jgi:hypothetical protein
VNGGVRWAERIRPTRADRNHRVGGDQLLPRTVGLVVLSFFLLGLVACTATHPREVSTVVSMLATNSEAAGISGAVKDESGQPIPGAEIWLLSAKKANPRGTTTTIEGLFSLSDIVPDVYTLQINAIGYGIIQTSNVALKAGWVAVVDARLRPGGEILQLVDGPPCIDHDSSSIGVRIINDDNGFPRVESK